MRGQFGKRTGVKDMATGVRHASSTFGKTANISFSTKVNDRAPFLVETEAERLVSQIISFAPDVIKCIPQGVAVDLITGTLLYTPEERQKAQRAHSNVDGDVIYSADFLIDLAHGRQVAIEVKLDSFPGSEAYQQKLVNAAAVLERYGCAFWRVVIPANQLMPIWSNVPLIAQAHLRTDLKPSEQVILSTQQALRHGPCAAREMLHALHMSANMLPVLVVNGIVGADLLDGHLKGDTRVESAQGDLSHLMLLQRLCLPS